MSTGLRSRLANGSNVVVAEGYLFEFERRGYLRAGAYVPEVVVDHPGLVTQLHEEFVHAGSDVCLAFTYYGHREKLKVVDRESDLEKLNRSALKIARNVADRTGTLMAGNICNTTVYKRDSQEAIEKAKMIFKEQIIWAVEEKADYIVAETFSELGEAMLALEAIKEYGNGLPAVVSMISHSTEYSFDGVPYPAGCRKLEEAGADVVGLNCGRGPTTMMPIIKEIRKACKGPICALPVPYRTTPEEPAFQNLTDPITGKQAFPVDLPAHACSRTQIEEFAQEALDIGVEYVGLCCGNASHYLRVVAEVYGRKPPASRFSPDMSQHFIWSDKDNFDSYYNKALQTAILTGAKH